MSRIQMFALLEDLNYTCNASLSPQIAVFMHGCQESNQTNLSNIVNKNVK